LRRNPIDVRRVTYTVPSRLIGRHLRIRLYDDRLCCYLGAILVATLSRIYPQGKFKRARQINYVHVIHSLVKKPQAFRYSQLRDSLLPNAMYQQIWSYVNSAMDARVACKFIVGLLYLAATEDCEMRLAEVVLEDIKHHRLFSISHYQTQFKSCNPPLPQVEVTQHTLENYNLFMMSHQEVSHVA
jgi:hypothetical protein